MNSLIGQDIKVATNFEFRPRQKFEDNTKSKKFTFFDSIRSIHSVSRIFGFTPFSVVMEDGEILGARVGIVDFLWFIVCLTIYAFVIYTCPYKLPLPFSASPALVHEHYVQITMDLSRAILTMILDMYNRHRIVNILIDLYRFDERVSCFQKVYLQYFLNF